MKKTATYFFTFAILISTTSFSQSWQWAKRFGSSGSDSGFNINTDRNGNSYITGSFADTVMFDTIQLISVSTSDMFFAKLDSNGTVIWALHYSGTGYGIEITPDSVGNCYLVGTFADSLPLTIGNNTFISKGGKDMFIAKLDTNLNIAWAKQVGGTQTEDPYSVKIDKWGNVYATTIFQGTIYLDSDSLISSGGFDIALLKYDNNGNLVWAKSAGSTGGDAPYSLSIDGSGNIILGGEFTGTCVFGTDSVTSLGGYDIFIAKYDSAGNVLWVKSTGSNDSDGNTVVRAGEDNAIYVAGTYLNTVPFGSTVLTGIGSADLFVAKCDSNGNFIWAKRAGSVSLDILNNMAIDDNDNIYITGYYGTNATFGTISITGNYDVFVAKYDSSGIAQWVKTAKGTGGQQSQRGWGVAVSNNSVYVTGDFDNNLNFDNSPLSFPSAGSDDIYVAKISPVPTGINDLNIFKNSVAIYPNPAVISCTITAPTFFSSTLIIYDITGMALAQQNFNEQATVNVGSLKTGMYVVEIKDKEGRSVKGKTVKEF